MRTQTNAPSGQRANTPVWRITQLMDPTNGPLLHAVTLSCIPTHYVRHVKISHSAGVVSNPAFIQIAFRSALINQLWFHVLTPVAFSSSNDDRFSPSTGYCEIE